MTKAGAKTSIKLAISFSLLAWLVITLDWEETLPLLTSSSWSLIILTILIFGPLVFISVVKWDILLKSQNINVGRWPLVQYYWTGFFASNFLPSNIGGDIVRLSLIRKKSGLWIGFSSIFIERLTGFLALLFLAYLSFLVKPDLFFDQKGVIFTGTILAMVLTSTGMFFIWRKTRSIINAGHEESRTHLPFDKKHPLSKVLHTVSLFQKQPSTLLNCLWLSVLFYFLRFIQQLTMVSALGLQLSWIEIVLLTPLIDLAWALPISINGLGVVEGAYVFLYGSLGLLSSEAMALAIVSRFIHLAASSAGIIPWNIFELRKNNLSESTSDNTLDRD